MYQYLYVKPSTGHTHTGHTDRENTPDTGYLYVKKFSSLMLAASSTSRNDSRLREGVGLHTILPSPKLSLTTATKPLSFVVGCVCLVCV